MLQFRTFYRHWKMLDEIDVDYTREKHDAYLKNLEKAELEPMSLRGAIEALRLDQPVHKGNCETFTKKWSGYGRYGDHHASYETMLHAERDSYKQASRKMKERRPIVDQYLQCLSDVVTVTAHKPLMLGYEANCHEINVRPSNIYDKDIVNGYACVNTWRMSLFGGKKSALVI